MSNQLVRRTKWLRYSAVGKIIFCFAFPLLPFLGPPPALLRINQTGLRSDFGLGLGQAFRLSDIPIDSRNLSLRGSEHRLFFEREFVRVRFGFVFLSKRNALHF